MNWLLITRARHLEEMSRVRELLAGAHEALVHLRQRAERAEAEAARYRGYYERLADDVLMRANQTSGPVHDAPERKHSLSNQLARGFSLVGNATGAPITGTPSHAAPAAADKR